MNLNPIPRGNRLPSRARRLPVGRQQNLKAISRRANFEMRMDVQGQVLERISSRLDSIETLDRSPSARQVRVCESVCERASVRECVCEGVCERECESLHVCVRERERESV